MSTRVRCYNTISLTLKIRDIKMIFLLNNQCRYHSNISAKAAMTVLAVGN